MPEVEHFISHLEARSVSVRIEQHRDRRDVEHAKGSDDPGGHSTPIRHDGLLEREHSQKLVGQDDMRC